MEQMYMIEIFIDKVTIFVDGDDTSTADKNMIVKVKFGPNTQFIIKEHQLIAGKDDRKDDTMEMNEWGKKQWSRSIRVGRSLLFPSYPDTILATLAKFPLEIEVWNDDVNEPENLIYVGIGSMIWQREFFFYLKETSNPLVLHQPLTVKEITTLYHECCCARAGEITFILRLSALGATITTEFQQNMDDPDLFCFRTDKAPSMFQTKRVDGDNPNFCMVGSLYETATLESPDPGVEKRIEVCTEMESCAVKGLDQKTVCSVGEEPEKKKHHITKIRMGDIVGPCGNANCKLAQKVKTYIRNLDAYKTKAGSLAEKKTEKSKKVCGACICKDDRWHREDCPEKQNPPEKCEGCGGYATSGETCLDKKNKHFDTGATPKGSTPTETTKGSKSTNYLLGLPNYKDAMFGRNYIIQDYYGDSYSQDNDQNGASTSEVAATTETDGRCACNRTDITSYTSKPTHTVNTFSKSSTAMGLTEPWIYNAELPNKSFCTDIPDDKECKCNPPKPSPPCRTFDCNCINETMNIHARKTHRPYCPLYKHKANCPVTMKQEEDEQKKDEEEDEVEPLPYGLPPVQLGPCPVMGRPCSVPDGFARMYRTAVLPTQPPSYGEAGKMCCSKEYHRIKKAIKEYMDYQKENDLRCINKFDVDTEKRCCDKEQVLKSLMGRECCGSHKMSIQEKFKQEKPPSPKP